MKKNKKHKKLKIAQPKNLKTKHPHICSGCGDQMTGCECRQSYIFAYRCPKCAGVPSETDKADLNIGIVRL